VQRTLFPDDSTDDDKSGCEAGASTSSKITFEEFSSRFPVHLLVRAEKIFGEIERRKAAGEPLDPSQASLFATHQAIFRDGKIAENLPRSPYKVGR
jgi:hypothetical protein